MTEQNYKNRYYEWLEKSDMTFQLNQMDSDEIHDSFYTDLKFGTGGLRGIMGAGTNRMNKYVVLRATLGLSRYINKNVRGEKSVVVAYDSRNHSKEFALLAAKLFESQNIKSYIFEQLRPTPELSFAVRYLGASAGIVITASHNPAAYNGYKVYWNDGGQISPDIANGIFEEISKIGYFEAKTKDDAEPIWIGKEIDEKYLECVLEQSLIKNTDEKGLKVIYTPLHGSGNRLVRGILEKAGFKNTIVVSEQELPDGSFPTVKSPNPEDKECFEYAEKYAIEFDANIIIATDPDSDRMGIEVKDGEKYIALSGNQVGILLMNFILANIQIPQNGAVVTTIVTTRMAEAIANFYNVKLFKTLTGFKYIGEKIHEFEQNGKNIFLFGFEESYGYLRGIYARDKDAVVASLLVCEMAEYYLSQGKTLINVMNELYEKFGGYYEELKSITLSGESGLEKMNDIMHYFRNAQVDNIAGEKIISMTDYLDNTELPKSDVLSFSLENNVEFVVRPSGTEPKIKIYFLSKGKNYTNAKEKAKIVKENLLKLIESIIY